MPDIRPITDFYDPTKAFDTATRYMQGQQHLALQAQQVQQQQANQEIDNKRQASLAAITENPSQAAPIYNDYMKSIGGPQVTDPNAFVANPKPFWDQLNFPPDSQEWKNATATIGAMGVTTRKRSEAEFNRQGMLGGAKQAITAAGGTATPEMQSFVAQSEQMQHEIGEATYDPHKQAEAAANKQTMAEHAGINAELLPTLDMSVEARRGVTELAKITPKIAAAQAKYEKDLGSNKGIAHAAGARREALAGDPDVAKYMENATASVPKIEEALAQTKQQIDQATKEAHHLFAGTKPGTTEDSLHTTVGGMKALESKAEYLEASLALAKDPMNPAKHATVNQIVQKMDARAGELYQAKTALSVRQDAAAEAARKTAYAEEYDRRVGLAQQEALASGSKSNVPAIAAKYSDKQFQVKPTDVLGAFKDPNAPLVRMERTEETAEEKVVGGGMGQEYIDTQKAGRTAIGKVNKLNRMESLMVGMDTGKLAPAITEIEAIGESFGIKVDPKLGAKQALIALTNEIALDFRNPAGGAGMPGNLSNYDLQFLRSMPPGLNKTPEGNKFILQTAREIANRDMQSAQMARDYRKKHGHIDEGFYDELANYAEAHPLFKDQQVPGAAPSTMTPGVPQFHDAEKQKRYDEWKQKHKP